MRFQIVLSGLVLALACRPLIAQGPGAPAGVPSAAAALPASSEEALPARAFVFMSAEHTPGASYSDASGGVDITRVRATLDMVLPVSKPGTLIVGLLTEYAVYDFDAGFGADALGEPWGDIAGSQISAGYVHTLNEHWKVNAAAGVESLREAGADFGDSLIYSARIGGSYAISKDVSLGVQGAIQTSLEDEPTIAALPTVDWKIDEHWKLTSGISRTPFVGIEYGTLDQQWTIGLRARYESREFRLASDNVTSPDGIGLDRRLPVYLDVDWNLSQQFSLNAMLGVALFERLKYQDQGGLTLDRAEIDPAPFFSFGVAFRF
jgi:Domain of unknown function (DUF6268)